MMNEDDMIRAFFDGALPDPLLLADWYEERGNPKGPLLRRIIEEKGYGLPEVKACRNCYSTGSVRRIGRADINEWPGAFCTSRAQCKRCKGSGYVEVPPLTMYEALERVLLPIERAWKTFNGRTILICELTDSHLINCIRMMIARHTFTQPIFSDLTIEAEKRGINWVSAPPATQTIEPACPVEGLGSSPIPPAKS